MKKILVTGSAGFIFSNFIRKAIYNKYPYSFISIDKVSGSTNSLYSNKNHTFHIADIRDQHIIDKIFEFEKPDTVIHAAAESHVDFSLTRPNDFITSNVLGTQVIINACLKHEVEKLLYVSCYDTETKAVTRNGIKSYDELNIGDLVLSINPTTGYIEEKEIEKIIVQDYDGDMYSFSSKRVNFLTTPNHRYLYDQDNKLNWTTSDQLDSINKKAFLPSGKINNIHNSKIIIDGIGEVDSDALFYLCGAFIGDGFTAYQEKIIPNKSGYTKEDYIKKSRNSKGRFISSKNTQNVQKTSVSKSYRVFFDVPKNDKCRIELENSLRTLGITYYAQKNKSGEHIYFSSKKWLDFFNTFGNHASNKYIPDWMFKGSYSNLYKLLMGLHDSDGHGFNIKGRTNSITTISIKLRDQVCYLGQMLGFFTRFSLKKHKDNKFNNRIIKSNYPAFQIYFSNIRKPYFPKSIKTKNCGKVWCLKVKDNKNFLVERGGITAFSGNTDEVYGHLTSDTDAGWTEESPLNPRNPYAASKAAGELLVRAAHQSHGLNYNITRSSNNYGPWQTTDKFIPKVIKCISNEEKIPVYGQGLQIRDWTHVFDNCSAIMSILEKGQANETYNISANQEVSNIEMVQKICNIMNKGHNLINHIIPDPRPGHDFRYSIDSSKIKSIGWTPKLKLSEGLDQCVEWYTMNQWMFR